MAAIEVRNLYKTFRRGVFNIRETEALRGVDLSVEAGEIFGVLGPNGAGKTTLLNILSTLLLPDSGEARILGVDVLRDPKLIRSRLSLCSGNANFTWSMKPAEVLTFYAMAYGIPAVKRRSRIDELIDLMELRPYTDSQFMELSTGTKQRLALAKALLNDPEVLFLDEPTRGLDPDIAHKIRNLIRRIHTERKITIILTTHYMPEVELLCGRIAFLKEGRIQALGTADQLKHHTSSKDLEAAFLELASTRPLEERTG